MPVPDCVEWNISFSLSRPDTLTPQRDHLPLPTRLDVLYFSWNGCWSTRIQTITEPCHADPSCNVHLISVFSCSADPRWEGSSGRCGGGRLGGVHQPRQRRRHDPRGGTEQHQSSRRQPHPDPHKVSYFTRHSKTPTDYLQTLVRKSAHNSCCSPPLFWRTVSLKFTPSILPIGTGRKDISANFCVQIQAALKYDPKSLSFLCNEPISRHLGPLPPKYKVKRINVSDLAWRFN